MAILDNIELIRGDSYEWAIVVTKKVDQGGSLADVPIDISGMTLAFTVKAHPDHPDASALCQAHVTFPADAESQAGRGTLFVPHTATECLPVLVGKVKPGEGVVYYDFQLSYVDGFGRTIVKTLAAGTKQPLFDATRRTVFV